MTTTLAPLLAAISAATQWLEAGGIEAAIVGGVAASIHGQPRVTKDVDFVAIAEPHDAGIMVEAAAAFGIVPRIQDALELALTTRVLLLRHEPSGVEIDVSLGALPFEHDLVAGRMRITIEGVELALARPEDVIIMKSLAMRPRDVADIAAIAEANPELDLERVRTTVEAFSAILEERDLLTELDRILAAVRRKQKK
jgi:predicted nucleotidyltransferase